LTVEGAYVAYALASRKTASGFELVALVAAIVLVASVFVAGKAITAARDSGFAGTWDIRAGKSKFGLQAFLLLIAVLLLGVMLLRSGDPKDSDTEVAIARLRSDLAASQAELHRVSQSIDSIVSEAARRNAEMQAKVDQMRSDLDRLTACPGHARCLASGAGRKSY